MFRLDDAEAAAGKPIIITEDRKGDDARLVALGPPPFLFVIEATGHHRKNPFVVLTAPGHDEAILNQLMGRRRQHTNLENTKTDALIPTCLARLASEKRPAPNHPHNKVAEALRALVCHCEWLSQDFDDRICNSTVR